MLQRYNEIRARRAAGEIDSGFTLIELLIVIVVLGILAAIVVFALGGVTGESAQAACNSDAKTVEIAVEAYNNITGAYPAAGAAGATALTTPDANGNKYLRTFPSNPGYYQITLAAGGEVDVAPATGADVGQATNANFGTAVSYDAQAAGATPTGCFAVK